MSDRKPIVFYHANCADGFTAAYVFWEHYGENYEYHPLDYKDSIPADMVKNRKVVFVDICLAKGVMETISALSGELCLVLDHHVGMQETFKELEAEHAIYGEFDLKFSGAGLAWNWLHGSDTPPWFISAIEDRDLWKFHIADTKSVLAYVAAHDFDFVTWHNFASLLEDPANRRDFAARGNAILQYKNRLIRSAIKNKVIHKRIGEHSVPCLNLDYSMASDAGHILAEHAPFAAIYNDEPEGRRYSLRSNGGDGVDVCAVAKQYGGGGHKNASGFFIPWIRLAEVEAAFAFNVQSGFGEK